MTLKHVSGFARDNVVNTFHFTGDAESAALPEAITTPLFNLYITDAPAGSSTAPIVKYLSSAFTTMDINLYEVPGTLEPDGRETPSGPPFYTYLGGPTLFADQGPRLSSVNLPSEVAVCCSYQGTPGAGVVQRRRRGRVYFGPFVDAASDGGGTGARPAVGLRNTLAESMQKMIADVEPTFPFVVYSRPFPGRDAIPRTTRPDLPAIPARPATTVNVTQLWVDNEFDTQRRRGLQRTGRTIIATA